MSSQIKRLPFYGILVIPFFFLALYFLIHSEGYSHFPGKLSFAVTTDLILTIPLIYFLIIRKTNIPNLTVIPIFVLGVILGSIFIPKEQQVTLNLVKTWVLPIVELSVLTFIFLQFRNIKKTVSAQTKNGLDFYTDIKMASSEILPLKFSLFFATELAVFYYAIFTWRVPKLKLLEYSSYKETGTRAILYALLGVVLIETTFLHFLIGRINLTAAWILTILSIYTGFQVLGFVKSLSFRCIQLENEGLKLKYGLFAETLIELDNIEKVESLSWKSEIDKSITTLSPLGELDSYNLVIHVKKPQDLIGFYGKKKSFEKLAFHVDCKELFLVDIANCIQKHS